MTQPFRNAEALWSLLSFGVVVPRRQRRRAELRRQVLASVVSKLIVVSLRSCGRSGRHLRRFLLVAGRIF